MGGRNEHRWEHHLKQDKPVRWVRGKSLKTGQRHTGKRHSQRQVGGARSRAETGDQEGWLGAGAGLEPTTGSRGGQGRAEVTAVSRVWARLYTGWPSPDQEQKSLGVGPCSLPFGHMLWVMLPWLIQVPAFGDHQWD